MMLWSQEVWSQGGCEAKSFHPRWWGQAIGHLAARPRRWSWLEEVEKPAEPGSGQLAPLEAGGQFQRPGSGAGEIAEGER